MKISPSVLLRRNLILLMLLMMIFLVAESLRVPPQCHVTLKGERSKSGDPRPIINKKEGKEKMRGVMKLHATGSSLPDCSHACGPCFPCKRVMVSFKCSTESCPIVYRCMCKGKYYHVPSN